MKNTKRIFRKLRPMCFTQEFMERIDKAYYRFERSNIHKMMNQLNKIQSIKDEIKPFLYNTETLDSGTFGMELDYIEKLIRMLKFNYENNGETLLRDKYYDEMLSIFKIYREEPIEAELVIERAEATAEHKYPMLKGTLDKYKCILSADGKGKSIQKFVESVLQVYRELGVDEDLIIETSKKYDGTSVVLELDEYGYVNDAITRGKNNKGVSLKALFKNMYVPYIKEHGIKANALQCEMMLSNLDIKGYSTEKILNKEIEEPYKNSRGSVTSIITSLTGYKYAEYLDPVPLRLIYQDKEEGRSIDYSADIFSKCKLAKKGKKLPKDKIQYDYKTFVFSKEFLNSGEVDDYEILMKIMVAISAQINKEASERNELPYAIDGVVISVVNENIRKKMGRKGEINQWQVAYKFESEEQVAVLKDVTYSVNRTGLVIPKAIYSPLIFNGTTQTKATLASRDFMNNMHLRIGDKVIIAYSNDVIPYFVGVESHSSNPELEFPTTCPACHNKLLKDGAHSYCTNLKCPPKLALQFTNFIKVLGFRDFSLEFVNTLIGNNIIGSFEDILNLDKKVEQMLNIKGIGKKKVQGMIDRLNQIKLYPLTEDIVFSALGIAGPKISKNILSEIPFSDLIYNPENIFNISINGVNDSKKDYIDKIKLLNENGEVERILEILKPEPCKLNEYKEKVRFTGFRDKELVKELNKRSVEVVNGYKNISYLVIPDVTYRSSKIDEANKRNIMVIDIEDLKNIYGIE